MEAIKKIIFIVFICQDLGILCFVHLQKSRLSTGACVIKTFYASF
jgi:hypothetical protein